jgi:hypothetical protein
MEANAAAAAEPARTTVAMRTIESHRAGIQQKHDLVDLANGAGK